MKPIKVRKDFTLKGNYYEKNDEIKEDCLTIEEIIKLNEKGFIEPLTQKEIFSLVKKGKNNNCKIEKKEGE